MNNSTPDGCHADLAAIALAPCLGKSCMRCARPGPEVAGSRVEPTVKVRSRIRASARAWLSGETGAGTRTTSAARRLDAGDKTKEMRNPPPSKRDEDGSRPEGTGSGQPQPIPAGGERSRPATSRLPRSMDSSGAIVGGGREKGKGREGKGRAPASRGRSKIQIYKRDVT